MLRRRCAPARDETAGYVSYAHSLVCDPWGRVQAQAEAAPQLLICDIDLTETDAVRAQIPVLRARRTDLYQLKYGKRLVKFTSLFLQYP